jgi:hypothetical protein
MRVEQINNTPCREDVETLTAPVIEDGGYHSSSSSAWRRSFSGCQKVLVRGWHRIAEVRFIRKGSFQEL